MQGTYFKICALYFKISQTYFLPPENPFENRPENADKLRLCNSNQPVCGVLRVRSRRSPLRLQPGVKLSARHKHAI